MLKRFSATKRNGAQSELGTPEGSIDELVLHIRQLIRHRGYDRTKITSEYLKRYLPRENDRDWQGETILRRDHATGQIDSGTMAYLVANVRVELQMAHERQTC
ncbi:hypothetical protein [Methylobacterium iners]|uniref:Integrase n=1 Tax=Methylobacterium iners TaxID=418707 RepID=A0ABQ4S2F3_9HYPH|nr:hypothetical protein [Methylobacterium iners]GJD97313.1 hypothetical protein OCOJLMKI_4542 [Methylobacterium iners]